MNASLFKLFFYSIVRNTKLKEGHIRSKGQVLTFEMLKNMSLYRELLSHSSGEQMNKGFHTRLSVAHCYQCVWKE